MHIISKYYKVYDKCFNSLNKNTNGNILSKWLCECHTLCNITSVSTINATTGIYGTISTTNNGNHTIPSKGNFEDIGEVGRLSEMYNTVMLEALELDLD